MVYYGYQSSDVKHTSSPLGEATLFAFRHRKIGELNELKHEEEFDQLLKKQIQSATGQRLEMLTKDKTGEKKLFCEVLRPALPNLDDLVLEYEMVSIIGVRIYLDMFIPRYFWAPECVGFVPHAQNITRDRFDFEQIRIQTMAINGIKYIPFSWDQLDRRPDQCRRVIYELLGRFSSSNDTISDLRVYEKEVIRLALFLNKPFGLREVSNCTGLKEGACRDLIRRLISKKIIKPFGKGTHRFHYYILEPDAVRNIRH